MEIKCVGRNMTPAEIEMAASLVSRYRSLRQAMSEIPKEDLEALHEDVRVEFRYPSANPDQIVTIDFCGQDVLRMIAVLADHAAMRLAEFGVDARDIV